MAVYEHILVAVDFSSAADTVGARAVELSRRFEARLHLIHVVEYLPPLDLAYEPISTPDWGIDEAELVNVAQQSLEAFARRLGVEDATRDVVVGVPRYEIVRAAGEHEADLIVIGSHGRHGLGRLLGSTANGVLHSAPCDVLAVRLQEE